MKTGLRRSVRIPVACSTSSSFLHACGACLARHRFELPAACAVVGIVGAVDGAQQAPALLGGKQVENGAIGVNRLEQLRSPRGRAQSRSAMSRKRSVSAEPALKETQSPNPQVLKSADSWAWELGVDFRWTPTEVGVI